MNEKYSGNQHSFFKEVTDHIVEVGLWTSAGAAAGFVIGGVVGAQIGHIAGSSLHVGTLDGNNNRTSPNPKKQ